MGIGSRERGRAGAPGEAVAVDSNASRFVDATALTMAILGSCVCGLGRAGPQTDGYRPKLGGIGCAEHPRIIKN
jgi:hypothetical protein